MICSKNGIKRYGESCSLNNNCIYPKCMENKFPIEEVKAQKEYLLNNPNKIKEVITENKNRQFIPKTTENIKTAKQWAEDYLNSEEGKAETEKWNKEAISYILLGKSTTCLNQELLDDISSFIKVEELSIEQIVERFGDLLTEKDIENIKKMRNAN